MFTVMIVMVVMVMISGSFAAPPAPTDVVAEDLPSDGGGAAIVTWTIPTGVDGLEGFQVWRTEAVSETTSRVGNERGAALLGDPESGLPERIPASGGRRGRGARRRVDAGSRRGPPGGD